MKQILTISFILISFSVISQPIVDGAYLPVRNTSIMQVWDTTSTTSLTPPLTGANQTWDYSTLFVNNGDTFTTKALDVTNTPYFSKFPTANLATYWNVPYALQDSLYSYFIIDTAGLHKIGGWSEKVSYDTSFYSTPSELMMPFEVAYQMPSQNSISVTVGYGTQLGYNVKIVQHANKTFTGEGYGTLSTPIGTFNDVVLLQEDVLGFDTIFVDVDNDGNYHGNFDQIIPSTNHGKYFHFVRNNTFASTHLMLLKCDQTATTVFYGWYTLPVDFGSIEGDVFDSTGAPVTVGDMYLYREHSNFTRNDILAITPLDANGHYQFDSIPYGEYRIACRADLNLYPGALTTYLGDTTDWETCPTVVTTNDITGIDIHLKYLNTTFGNGFVGGTVTLDYDYGKKGWGNPNILGDPVGGINVSLEQIPGGSIVSGGGQTTTNIGAGAFDWSNVGPGTYRLWVDVPGMHMAGSYDITITGSENLANMDFIVGEDSIWPASWPAQIEEKISNNQLMAAYPNPNNGLVTVKTNELERGEYSIEVYSIVGQLLQTTNFNLSTPTNKEFTKQIDISNLPAGTYFLTLNKQNEPLSSVQIIKN